MTSRADYLLEVGTEELPASFLQTAIGELKTRTEEALAKNRLAFEAVRVLYTPRRLALCVDGIATRQSASEALLKGPPVSVGLDADGKPTQAAMGFARKNGIEVSDLRRETVDGAEYLVYHQHSAGEPVEQILPEILPDVVLGLSGSHFMSWDESEIKFSRPIRWLVSLLNTTPVPLHIGTLTAGTQSRGHRFFAQTPAIHIDSVATYTHVLETQGCVKADPDQRKEFIRQGLAAKCRELGGEMIPNEDLLEMVTMLVESPALIAGQFEERFLVLPPEVIITVMEAHQKYFAVANPKGGILPYFITIANNPMANAAQAIAHGNQKVLRARLEDAAFFFAQDTQQPLAQFSEALKGITFQKGLGSLYDKSQRVQHLVAKLGDLTHRPETETKDAVRAAMLYKADLATNLVRELTELQGVMGMHYARRGGESEAVAVAIEEHYHPRFMGDTVAQSPVGILLSLADKLDTLLAVFSQKDARLPTGSKDPMGLRRLALGIIQTIIENRYEIDLEQSLVLAYDTLGPLAVKSNAETLDWVRQFLLQRFKGYLLDQQYAYDAIDAVLEADRPPFGDILSVLNRLAKLKNLRENPEIFASKFYEPANRTARILGAAYQADSLPNAIDPTLFEDDSEGELFDHLQKTPLDASLEQQMNTFETWAPVVDRFFGNVLVNADKIAVRDNRYLLLSLLNRQYRQFADFTKLVV